MKHDQYIRQELVKLLRGGNAHMDFEEMIADFPPEHVGAKAPHTPYSCWHLLEHIRIAQWDILEFIRNADHVSPHWPEGYRPSPKEKASPSKWDKTVSGFREDLEAMVEIIQDPDNEILAPIPHAKDYTIFREVLVLADHNSNHMGEIAILRQVLNLWPEKDKYLG